MLHVTLYAMRSWRSSSRLAAQFALQAASSWAHTQLHTSAMSVSSVGASAATELGSVARSDA